VGGGGRNGVQLPAKPVGPGRPHGRDRAGSVLGQLWPWHIDDAQDVLEGNLVVQVLVALIHPAAFIELTFKQKMEAAS
jgi:hypothetical protein